jgi:hypothetical protein
MSHFSKEQPAVFSLTSGRSRSIAGAAAALSLIAACSSGSSTSADSPQAASSAVNLAGVCPATIVVQTNWDPEADHFALYELAARGGTVDTSTKSYTAELIAHGGQDTGVKIQIRSGGPEEGNEQDSALMYQDPSILLGQVQTDEAIQNSGKLPTVAIIGDREEPATVLMWSPQVYPKIKNIAGLRKNNVTVLYKNGAPFMDYLTGAGILKKSQVDGSYNGTPARFVASGGTVASQAFATEEPYEYAHEISQWDRPMTYQLVSSYGYDPYPSLATLPANVTKYAACFKKLVPIIQQGIVDYVANPKPADNLIVKLVSDYNDGWDYDAGEAAYAAKAQVTSGIIGNSALGSVGSFDLNRIKKFISIVAPIYSAEGKKVKPGLTPQDLVTNKFIDPSIHLPAKS